MTRDQWMPLLMAIADRADEIALRLFRTSKLSVEAKGDMSPVTQADREIEREARRLIRSRHPEVGVLGEEEGEAAGTGAARLIIDPIDATRNFVRGIPVFATLLAMELDGEVVAGLVSAPALASRWRAVRGGGAFCGDRRLQVSSIDRLDRSLLLHGDLAGAAEPAPPPGMIGLTKRVERTRGFGDFYQHALVAEGAAEVAVDPATKPWDVAALQVIVEEAGGRATSLDGERTIYGGSLVSSNGHLHQAALAGLTVPGRPRHAE